jgi:RPA family protein
MEGAARVFAGEFRKATLPVQGAAGGEGVLTPFGLSCRLLFIGGALIELHRRGTDSWTGRIADPSGAFEFRMERPDALLQQALLDLTPPCFVTILGQTRPGRGNPPAGPTLRLLEVIETGREIRDLWIVRTAEVTLQRLSLMRNAIRTGGGDAEVTTALRFYGTTEADIRDMAETVRQALATVRQSSSGSIGDEDLREKVLAIIRESAGRSGITLDTIIDLAGRDGIDANRARETVRALVLEDECYQPARDVFKPL